MCQKVIPVLILLTGSAAWAQPASSAESERQGAAPGCLIVKHKGTMGRRILFTTLTGFPVALGAKYDLVDSAGYKGAKLSYGGRELDQIQKAGTRIIVLQSKPTAEDVKNARLSCDGSLNGPTK